MNDSRFVQNWSMIRYFQMNSISAMAYLLMWRWQMHCPTTFRMYSMPRSPINWKWWSSLNEAWKLVPMQYLTWRQSAFVCWWVVRHTSLAHQWMWLYTEREPIYPSQLSRIETIPCSRYRYCHSGYAISDLSHCLATRWRRLWPQWKYQAPSNLLLCLHR